MDMSFDLACIGFVAGVLFWLSGCFIFIVGDEMFNSAWRSVHKKDPSSKWNLISPKQAFIISPLMGLLFALLFSFISSLIR